MIQTPLHGCPPARTHAACLCLLACLFSLGAGCATVRPEQRAILADPTMQFDDEAAEQTGRQHVFEKREASFGGGAVEGGGCGCN